MRQIISRCLVESVYRAAPDLPTQELRDARDKAVGGDGANAELARYAILPAGGGYDKNGHQWEAEGLVHTRLEDPPRATIRLAIEVDNQLRPLAQAAGWIESEISTTKKWAEGLEPPSIVELPRMKPDWPSFDEGYRVLVLTSRNGDMISACGAYRCDLMGLAKVKPECQALARSNVVCD